MASAAETVDVDRGVFERRTAESAMATRMPAASTVGRAHDISAITMPLVSA